MLPAVLLLLLAGSVVGQSRRVVGNTRADDDKKPPVSSTDPARPPRVAPAVPPPVEQHPPVPSTPPPVHHPPPHYVSPPPEVQTPPVHVEPIIIIPPPVPYDPPVYEEGGGQNREAVPLGVCLQDRLARPDQGGYSFSADQLMAWDDGNVEITYEVVGAKGYFVTPRNIRIVKLGPCESVRELADQGGTSSTIRYTVALPGHGYAIRMPDGTVVRLRVVTATTKEVVFEWL